MPDETLEDFQARVAGMRKPTELKLLAVRLYGDNLQLKDDLQDLQAKASDTPSMLAGSQSDEDLKQELRKEIRDGEIRYAQLNEKHEKLAEAYVLVRDELQTNEALTQRLDIEQRRSWWRVPLAMLIGVLIGTLLLILAQAVGLVDLFGEDSSFVEIQPVPQDSDLPAEKVGGTPNTHVEDKSVTISPTFTFQIDKLVVVEQVDRDVVVPRPRPGRHEAKSNRKPYNPPHWTEGLRRFHQPQ